MTLLSYSYSITGISKPADKVECTKQMHLKLSANLIIRGSIIMEKMPKEMLKAYVDSQKFSNTTEIMDAMKKMLRDV